MSALSPVQWGFVLVGLMSAVGIIALFIADWPQWRSGMSEVDISKATPRPWRVEADTALIWGDCTIGEDGTPDRLGVPIAECRCITPMWWNGAEIDPYANAALIEAAVNERDADKALIAELVEALEKASDLFGKIKCDFTDPRSMCRDGYKLCDAAIARAKVQP